MRPFGERLLERLHSAPCVDRDMRHGVVRAWTRSVNVPRSARSPRRMAAALVRSYRDLLGLGAIWRFGNGTAFARVALSFGWHGQIIGLSRHAQTSEPQASRVIEARAPPPASEVTAVSMACARRPEGRLGVVRRPRRGARRWPSPRPTRDAAGAYVINLDTTGPTASTAFVRSGIAFSVSRSPDQSEASRILFGLGLVASSPTCVTQSSKSFF